MLQDNENLHGAQNESESSENGWVTSGRAFDSPDIEKYWRSIKLHWIPIATIIVASLILAGILTSLVTPRYTAKARIEISRQDNNVTNVEGVQPADIGKDQEFYQTQYALLEARSLAERVARSLYLAADDSFFELFGIAPEKISAKPDHSGGLNSNIRKTRSELATNLLRGNVTVDPVRGSRLVDVLIESPDPKMSAKIANKWVEEFIQSNLDRRFESTNDAREFLEERLADLKSRLEDSERKLVGYSTRTAIILLSDSKDSQGSTQTQRTLLSADLEALNAALTEASAERISAQSRLGRVGGSNQETLSNAAINGLRARLADIVAERAKLLAQFEPEYPTVQALTSQVESLKQSIANEEARVRAGTNNAYREAVKRENTLKQRVAQLKDAYLNQRGDGIQYNILQREVDANRELYNSLLQRYKEIGVASVGVSNVTIVDRARIPGSPSSPKLPLNLAIALLVGCAISAIYVFAVEQIDQTLRDPSEVKDSFGLSLLGMIPKLDGVDICSSLSDKKSIASEAYFSIGTALSFLTDHGVPRSILLTSTRPNEGKSTSSIGIAQSIARMGKSVFLIDGDLRNPSLHLLLNSGNEKGLSNYLSGEDDTSQIIRQTEESNLSFMSAGPVVPNPTELLSTDRMAGLISLLGQQYDVVIVDGPPVLGIADVPLLAKSVEGVLFTIEANGAKLGMIQSVLHRLQSSNAAVFGAIVTKLDQRKTSYGYSSDYGYGGQNQLAET